MRRWRSATGCLWLGLVLLAGAPAAMAQSLLQPSEWLPPGSDTGAAVSERPQTLLEITPAGGKASFLVSLGELAFRSSEILGGDAAKAGLSCDACHPGGDTNTRLFIPGLSGKAGTVDVSHSLWNHAADDGADNPLSIPSLRGIGTRAPFGFRGHFLSLRDFTRRVIVVEFAGAEPAPKILDALVEFQNEIAAPRNPLLQADGKLDLKAGDAAHRGEAIFAGACAQCHQPSRGFSDREPHDIGSGGAVVTPSLTGVGHTAPYFHDGRFATLTEVVDYFDRRLGLNLSSANRDDLVAYLQAIGGAAAVEPVTLAGDLARLNGFVELLRTPLLDEDAGLAEPMTRMLRGEVGRIDARFLTSRHMAAHQVLVGWAEQLSEIARQAEAGEFPATRTALDALEAKITADTPVLTAQAPTSLYDPAVLKAALANRPVQ